MWLKLIKFSSLICFAIILIAGGLLFYHFQTTTAQTIEYQMDAWLWSDNYGWISLNSDNCIVAKNNGLDCDPQSQYKVTVDAQSNISGWGWSSNVGWICFGDTCGKLEKNLGNKNPTGGWRAKIDNDGKITGWAKILSLGDEGWLKLRAENITGGIATGQDCYNCQPHCDPGDYLMEGDPPQPVVPLVCLRPSKTDFDSCQTCFTRTRFNNQNLPDPIVEGVIGGNGEICSTCNSCQQEENVGLVGSRITCQSCSNCERFGLNQDLNNGKLVGWAWNGDDLKINGAGWVHVVQGGIAYPWLETRYGPIYTPGVVKQKAISAGVNASYCIFADNIEHVASANCQQPVIPGVNITFPTVSSSQGIYRNALGKIDLEGLSKVTKILRGNNYNKYDNLVKVSGAANWSNDNLILDNSVYVINGDLKLGKGLVFNNASSDGQFGNGLVIVDGNLIINGDTSYSQNNVGLNIKKLASVAWVVKGDVIIDPGVSKAVGAFLVLGKVNTYCQNIGDFNYPRYQANSCGVIFSGEGGKSLTIYGLMMAKAFDFRRTYSDIVYGSERIIYDGRLVANPPPGMKGFAEGLPIIRDFL